MNNFENFSENYYPNDITSAEEIKNNISSVHKNSSQNQNFSIENLSKLFGENENLISLLLSKKLGNIPDFSNLISSPDILSSLSSISGKKNSNQTSKKEKSVDNDFFESY